MVFFSISKIQIRDSRKNKFENGGEEIMQEIIQGMYPELTERNLWKRLIKYY